MRIAMLKGNVVLKTVKQTQENFFEIHLCQYGIYQQSENKMH